MPYWIFLNRSNPNIEFNNRAAPKSHFSYFFKEAYLGDDLNLASSTVNCIKAHSKDSKTAHIFIDYTAPSAINALSHPESCISLAWNNLSPAGKYCGRPVDFLVLDTRDAVGFLPDEKFEEKIKSTNAATAEGFKQDRQSRALLLSEGLFDSQHFTLACDLGRLKIFMSDRVDNN